VIEGQGTIEGLRQQAPEIEKIQNQSKDFAFRRS
jgi:hypothetical protein